MRKVSIIDSHTGGEPTRIVIAGRISAAVLLPTG